MNRRVDHLLQDPARLVALLVAGQVVGWTLAPALTHSAPPLDVVESYMWGREWVLATYKHPAMPSWVLEASRLVTGAVGWPAYLVSQLFIAATFVSVFLLGRDLMGPERAAAGTLLLTGIISYSWPTPEFNHSIAQTPFWAAFALALWRAVDRRSFLWWALAGALAAGGLYAKLTTGLLLVSAAAWIVLDPRARAGLATPGPWLGLAIFLALTAPLALWMVDSNFALLKYAEERSAYSRGRGITSFLLSALGTFAGMLALLAVARLIGPRGASGGDAVGQPPQPVDKRALLFLAVLAAGPPLLAVAAALLTGSGLRSAWGSSMFNLAGLLAVGLLADRFGPALLRRIAVSAAALLIVLPIAYAATVGFVSRGSRPPLRVQWPQVEITKRMSDIWARETGAPLRIVAGENWIAGLVGLTHPDKPSLLSNAHVAFSPWISPARLEAEGMLVLWDGEKIPIELQPYLKGRKGSSPQERFYSPRSKRAILVRYMIVAPKRALARDPR